MRAFRTKTGARRLRSGFSLVELLVVIGIIGILIAFLLPAVQAARESSRRASCQNNLRQIGIALLNYESAYRSLPIGAQNHWFARVPGFGVSWWVGVADLLETPISDRFDFEGPNNGWPLLHAANAKVINRLTIDVAHCPSSALPPLWDAGPVQVMMPSYVGISGSTNYDNFPESRVNQCCLPENQGQIGGGGALIPNRAIRLQQILDGLANTVIVGECSAIITDSQGREVRIDGGYPDGWTTGTAADGTPPDYECPSPPSWNITTIRYAPNWSLLSPGIHFNRGANNPLTSSHPNGVSLLFVDGSVHFMPDELDLTLLKSLATRDDRDTGSR